MSDDVENGTPPDEGERQDKEEAAQEEAEQGYEPHFADPEEFFVEYLSTLVRRRIGVRHRWCAQWWKHEEAVTRIYALWSSWEHLRRDGELGMSTWWLHHAGPHLDALLSNVDGPFVSCTPEYHDALPSLPYELAPEETWDGVVVRERARPLAAWRPAAEQRLGSDPEDLDSLMKELDTMVGLAEFKREVRTIVDLVEIGKRRVQAGLSAPPTSRHLVFVGPPGTGKTSAARMYGKILAATNAISKGHLVETGRPELVGQYLGETTRKTQDAFDRARGGVLLVDEAYALARSDSSREFGREAIDVLVKLMEDHRDDVVVIASGYPDEMEAFLSANPGLRSRFTRTVTFEGYDSGELVKIVESMAVQGSYWLDEAAKSGLFTYFELEVRGDEFGHGRTARRVFEAMVEQQAMRLAEQPTPSTDPAILSMLTFDDLPRTVS